MLEATIDLTDRLNARRLFSGMIQELNDLLRAMGKPVCNIEVDGMTDSDFSDFIISGSNRRSNTYSKLVSSWTMLHELVSAEADARNSTGLILSLFQAGLVPRLFRIVADVMLFMDYDATNGSTYSSPSVQNIWVSRALYLRHPNS